MSDHRWPPAFQFQGVKVVKLLLTENAIQLGWRLTDCSLFSFDCGQALGAHYYVVPRSVVGVREARSNLACRLRSQKILSPCYELAGSRKIVDVI